MVAGHLQEKHGYWYMVLSYKDANGVRHQPWINTKLPVRGNKRRAQAMLEEYKNSFAIPEPEAEKPEINLDMYFTDYLKKWLELIRSTVQETTYGGYSSIINRTVIPYFEKKYLRLGEVRPIDLQGFLNAMGDRDIKPATIHHYHMVIHAAFKYLIRLDLIPNNPADRVVLPKKEKYIAEVYNEEWLNKLFEVSKDHPLGLVIQVAACYGLRRGEIVGLKWNAIDFETNTLIIKHVVTRVDIDGKSTLVMKDRAKTQSSLRTLPLVGDIREQLLDLRKQQERNKKLCGKSYNHEFDEYIFVDAMGNLLKPDYVTGGFRNILAKHKMKKIRFHDLRHSCATLLLAHDVPMKLIQEYLGHSNIGTTADIYAHADFRTKLMSSEVMNETLNFPKTGISGKQK